MPGNDRPPEFLFALFPIVFPLFWVAVLAFIALQGWRSVESAYSATSDPPLSARRVYWGSMSFGGSLMSPSYSSCINAWISETGLWLRPSLLFRPFHPMIFIPWARMASIGSERALLLFRRTRIKLVGDVPDLLLAGRLGRAVLEALPPPRSRH